MKPIATAFAAAIAAAAPAAAGLPDGADGWLAELVGSCWSATYPNGARDTQCYSAQYDRFLRGTIELRPAPGSTQPGYRGDSVAFWNGERGEIAVHYWSDAGNHGVMTGRVEGEAIVFALPARGGGEPQARTIWTRAGPEGFRVVQQLREGEQWVESLSLDYSRAATLH